MISSEVERTLVKSPPELWAELSDPAALARHLGELGEIRIVRTEPERVVEWAAEHTTGSVSIKPSGWGTRVTLSATREQGASAPAQEATSEAETDAETEAEVKAEITVDGTSAPAAEPQVVGAILDEPAAEPEVVGATLDEPAVEPEVVGAILDEPAAEPEGVGAILDEDAAEPDPAAKVAQREPRRGFFARLFRRSSRTELVPESAVGEAAPSEPDMPTVAGEQCGPTPTETLSVDPPPERPDAFAAVRQVLAPETFAATHPFAAQPAVAAAPAITDTASARMQSAPEARAEPKLDAAPQPAGEPSTDIGAELMAAEDVTADEVSAAEVTAVLTAVLDRLGAAHHRPFSRG
jgi:hypothetical protein